MNDKDLTEKISQYIKKKKQQKAIPVITMVLYFGKSRWKQPKSLKALMEIPDGLEEYVNDCTIHVFEISWLEEEVIKKFNSDFGIVANFFVNKRKNKDYVPDDETEIQHVDEVLKLLSVMTGDNRYEQILSNSNGVRNMCEVADRLEKRGIEKGIEKGIGQGRLQLIMSMIENGKTPEEIADFCGIEIDEIINVME